jgi:universal stress protein A
MNGKKILFPTDFSHTGDAALAFATMLARESNGRIIIVHAQESPLAYGGGEMYYGIPEPSTEELMTMLHEIKPADPNVAVEYRLVMGRYDCARLTWENRHHPITHGKCGGSDCSQSPLSGAGVQAAGEKNGRSARIVLDLAAKRLSLRCEVVL